MTYGENSGLLRFHLATLLRQHRIQQRIGGAGIHTVPVTTTVAEREEIGRLIQRYRFGVLTWCQQALAAANPTTHGFDTSVFELDLRRRLDTTRGEATANLPTLADLTVPQEFALVDVWRRAARAAAMGEHDLTGEIAHDHPSLDECLTVIKDAAEIIRGLIVLDRRYKNVPGWEHLRDRERLQRAADGCAFIIASDYAVDRRGWRPAASTIDGPPRPGIAGVIQAEHNTLMHLADPPNALNLRRLLDSQRELSTLLVARVEDGDATLAAQWAARADIYARLYREARNLGGSIGSGGAAVGEAANAVGRLRKIPQHAPLSRRALDDLHAVAHSVDYRIADVIDQGAREHLYFARSKVPRIVENDGRLVHRVRERFVPLTTP